jgi:NADH:ubiquinone oxidoreductase subunit 2 (subunit N)
MGYLFIGVSSGDSLGLQASLLYLFFYIIMVFAFFLVIMYVQKPTGGEEVLFIFQLRGFSQLHRNLSIFLALTLFSMAGIPPLAGFFGKFFLFFSAYKAGNLGLVCFGLVMNIISAFYYLRIIRYLFFEVSRIEVPEFLFFLGTEVVYVLLFNVLFLVLLVILVVFPVFLNDLLRVSEVLVFSVRYVRL